MMDAIKLFLFFVDVFFVIYLIGYSTFLFLSVVVGASELYEKRMDEKMKGTLRHDFYIPISIIVPAHNEEMTVVDTVFSLLEQDYKLYEIIVVDDGSTDGCPQICDEYADKYGNVYVIHKNNGGLSDARNVGTLAARGEYVTYIDSDDYVSPDYLEVLWRLKKKYQAELTVTGIVAFAEGSNPPKTKKKRVHL